MKYYRLKCDQCGADLEIEETRKLLYCQYCGNRILVDDEVERTEIKHIIRDEAEIQNALTRQRKAELHYLNEKRKHVIIMGWLFSCGFLFIVSIIDLLIHGEEGMSNIGSACFLLL